MIRFLKSLALTTVYVLVLTVQRTDSFYKCLANDAEIQAALTSSTPPFDNYFSISRAIFPSTDVSSLYVRIRVKFLSANGTKNETQSYTWAMSCLYVSTQYINLFAMNVYSLYAVFPNRRQRELEITIPELCSSIRDHDNGSDSKMLYFLSTLQDIAIRPDALDPQQNTAECVVKDHTGFTSNIFTGVRHYMMMNICWCVLAVSFVLAFVAALLFDAWPITIPQEDKKKSVEILFGVVLCLEIIAAIVACLSSSPNRYEIVFVISVVSFPCVFALIYWIKTKEKKEEKKERKKRKKICRIIRKKICRIIRAVVPFSAFYMSFHHLIWILLGVLTEPFWALPVLVVACSFCVSVYILAFYNCRAFRSCNWLAVSLSAVLIVVLFLFFFITVVVSQSFLSSKPIAGLIQSALVAITTLWVKYITGQEALGSRSGKENPNPTLNSSTASDKMELITRAGRSVSQCD